MQVLKKLGCVMLVGYLTGCAHASQTLAENSAPSPLVMGTVESCYERIYLLTLDKKEAREVCGEHRSMEVSRDTTTAKYAAQAAKYEAYNGVWRGEGYYNGIYYQNLQSLPYQPSLICRRTSYGWQSIVVDDGGGFGHYGNSSMVNVVARSHAGIVHRSC